MPPSILQQDIEYVDVRPGPDRDEPTSFYEKWVDQCLCSKPVLVPSSSAHPFHLSLCKACHPRADCVGRQVCLIDDIDRLSESFFCSADALRRLYPGYSLVVSDDFRLTSLFALPDIKIHPADSDEAELERVSSVVFTPIPRRIAGKVAGSLADNVILGSYRITWNVRTCLSIGHH